jgi:APA family basic amino acid/polyamine antiporter
MSQPKNGETAGTSASPQLARILGARDAAAIMVSNMIGVGILTLPGMVAMAIGNLELALAAWALAGLLSLAGALVHAELGCRNPEAGGDYVFLREAFGPLAAFLSGWTSFVVGFPGAIAASSMAAAVALFDAAGIEKARWPLLALALVILSGISAVHAAGLEWGKRFQNSLFFLKVGILIVLVGAGLLLTVPEAAAGPTGGGGPHFATAAFFLLFAYSGWNSAAYVAGEIRDPRRTLPRALIAGVVLVTVLYLAVNLAYYRVVPMAEMGNNINILGEVAGRILGKAGGQVFSLALAFVFFGSASAMIITGPRIYYAMARDGLFPAVLTRIAPRSQVPARALWLQTLWAAGLLAAGTALTAVDKPISETFERIVGWTIFAILPFAALTTASVFVLRRKDRKSGRDPAFPAPGYPWIAVAFIVVTVAVELGFLIVGLDPDLSGPWAPRNRLNAIIGGGLVLSGMPAFLLWARLGKGRPQAGA